MLLHFRGDLRVHLFKHPPSLPAAAQVVVCGRHQFMARTHTRRDVLPSGEDHLGLALLEARLTLRRRVRPRRLGWGDRSFVRDALIGAAALTAELEARAAGAPGAAVAAAVRG
jgi:hypothetical protein